MSDAEPEGEECQEFIEQPEAPLPARPSVFDAIPCTLVLIFGVAMIAIGAIERSKTIESQSFVSAQARITEMIYEPPEDEDDFTEFHYKGVLIESGKTFESKTIKPGAFNTSEFYRSAIDQYGDGDVHEVFVSPTDPTKVVLQIGRLSPAFVWILWIGVVVTVLGVFLVWCTFGPGRKQRKNPPVATAP